MKRSQINQILLEGLTFMRSMNFQLPPFATWTPERWKTQGADASEIPANQLGWDITDFGSGQFEKQGLFLFTVRNGNAREIDNPKAKPYAEKIMIVREDQVTPYHFHFLKMEDIINRGGGNLMMQLSHSDAKGNLAPGDVTVSKDGVKTTIPGGGVLKLEPGESVTLPTYLYHQFWGEPGKGQVLVGEVSRVNDDHTDNRFLAPIGRFPAIEEDVAPVHLLVGDYKRYYSFN